MGFLKYLHLKIQIAYNVKNNHPYKLVFDGQFAINIYKYCLE